MKFNSLNRVLTFLLFTVSIGLLSLPVSASRGQYDRMFVVPTPGPIEIDANLDDWDRSAEIEVFVVPETRGSQNARVSVMYDDKALYLGGVVRDNSPMMNRHDPEASGNKGWDADAIQFRMVTDPSADYPLKDNQFVYGNMRNPDGTKFSKKQQMAADKRDDIVHLTMWHYTDEQRPALQMHYGFTYRVPQQDWSPFGVVPDDLFDGAYRETDDGLGYVFEYRIPWSTLGAERALKAGDEVAATVQFNWSRPDGLSTAGGAAWAYDLMREAGFPFQSGESWGKLIFLDEGNVSRDLVDAGLPPEEPLPLGFEYKMPVDGEVTIQLVDDQKNIVRTLVAQGVRNAGPTIERWNGKDDSGNLLEPGEYRWIGNYTDQPVHLKFRFSVHNSGNPPYPTPNNKGGWGGDHGNPTDAVHIPGTKDMLLSWDFAEYGWGIIRVNEKGRKKWGSPHGATSMATDGNRIFIIDQSGFHADPGVKVLNIKDGRPMTFDGKSNAMLEQVDDADKNKLTGLAYAKGRLYVSYQHRNTVAVFDANTAELIDTIEIEEPTNLAATPDDRILVVVAGSRVAAISQDMSVSTRIREHLDKPQGLAVDDQGRIYVANRGDLNNVSVFDEEGHYIKSIGRKGGRNAVGAYQPDGMFAVAGIALDSQNRLWVAERADSPKRISVWSTETGENVDEFFGGSSYFGYCVIDPARPDEIYAHNVLWKVDWDRYSVTPISTIWRPLSRNHMLGVKPDGYQGRLRVFTHENGQQFAFGQGNNASILSYRKGDIFQPFMATFQIRRGQYGYGREQFGVIEDEEKFPNGKYLWQDQNDDAIVQEEEIQAVEDRRIDVSFQDIDHKSMTAWMLQGFQMTPVSWENGRPVYSSDNINETFLREHSDTFWGYLWLDPDGSIYTYSPGRDKALTWTKWTADGKKLVNYPGITSWRRSLGYPVIKPGRLWGMTGPLGVAGDYTGNATYYGMSHIFDRNGQYVAGLGYDGRVGGDPSIQGQPEGQGGAMVHLNIDGQQRYFLLQGGQDSRVMEIMNLDTIQPLAGGTFTLTPEAAEKARKAWQEYDEEVSGSNNLTIVEGRDALDDAPVVGKRLEDGRGFEAAMAYDKDKLYVRFEVNASSPLINTQADPKLIFKGGNLLDIQLATDPDAEADREAPAPGDLRLLVSRSPEGDVKAVLYQPRIPGYGGERTILKSPTGQEAFDAITDVSEAVQLDVEQKSADRFAAVATVPLKTIGFNPKSGQSYDVDIGYIFGNANGTEAMVRSYWMNNGFSANVVDDIPNESRLAPHLWGEAKVE